MTLADDYAADTVDILEDWKETLTIKRRTVTYDAAGKPVSTWATVETVEADWQPVAGSTLIAEAARKVKSDALLIAPVDADIEENDQIHRADGTWWYVNYVRAYEDHLSVFLTRTEGSD